MLNFSTPNVKKRIEILIADFASFLILNVLRIALLSALFISEFKYFSEAHIIAWHLVSAVFVIVIWIATAEIRRINGIPFYSDFIYLESLLRKKTK
jgi:hypothetical protein